jgi:hypothetical protein
MLSGQFQGFITQTFAHFQDRILTLHTGVPYVSEAPWMPRQATTT